MKKTLLVAIAAITLASCKKEDSFSSNKKYCIECENTITMSIGSRTASETVKINQCNLGQADIDAFIKAGNYTISGRNDKGEIETMTSKVTCNKKRQ